MTCRELTNEEKTSLSQRSTRWHLTQVRLPEPSRTHRQKRTSFDSGWGSFIFMIHNTPARRISRRRVVSMLVLDGQFSVYLPIRCLLLDALQFSLSLRVS